MSGKAVFPVFFSNDESCDGETQKLLSPSVSLLAEAALKSAGTFAFDSGALNITFLFSGS